VSRPFSTPKTATSRVCGSEAGNPPAVESRQIHQEVSVLRVRTTQSSLRIGRHFSVSFQRTLRIPDDGGTYPLPPGLGRFPIRRVNDYAGRVPATWQAHGGVFIPMYQREALWMSFNQPDWRPCAAKIAIGKVNAINGAPWDPRLSRSEQDYIVCPDQPWLDGINAGKGFIRQFVAMPLGRGYTVEGQVTGREEFGGIQIMIFAPKPGLFPGRPPREEALYRFAPQACCYADMGIGAGGRMRQEIYPDEYGIDTWDETNTGRVFIHIVNSMDFREIAGEEPPATPVSAKTYTEAGLPWFDLYDEGKGDLAPSGILAGIKSIKEKDAEKGFTSQQDDSPVAVPDGWVKKLGTAGALPVTSGNW
jgi:hypothetical protein